MNTFFTGSSIRHSDTEQLTPVTLEQLKKLISGEEGDLAMQTRRLHSVRRIDRQAFDQAKTSLPFFIAARFKDGIRSTARFESICGMTLDFDRCIENTGQAQRLKTALAADPSLALAYLSPSGEGIKCVYLIDPPITDTKLYSDFYRHIALSVAKKAGLAHCVDLRTFDVTRISFLSFDPQVYFNPGAVPLCWQPFAEAQVFDFMAESPAETLPAPAAENTVPPGRELTDEVYAAIRKKLSPAARIKPQKIIFVPEILEEIIPFIRAAALENSIALDEVRDIHYGKKLIFKSGRHRGEVNLYWGRKGFSVVVQPKAGMHQPLSEAAEMIVWSGIAEFTAAGDRLAGLLRIAGHKNN